MSHVYPGPGARQALIAANNRRSLAALAPLACAVVTLALVKMYPDAESLSNLGDRERHVHHQATSSSPIAHHQSAGGSSSAMSRPATMVKPISCEPLPHVPGKAITTAIVSFPPNAYTPAHRHPGSVTAFVLRGAIRSQLEGGDAVTYAAGDTWFEPPGMLHQFAENASATEPAELLAVFVADEKCGPLVVYEQ